MALLKTIKDQAALGFCGRINLLVKGSQEFVGAVLINEENIIDCQYQGQNPEIAILKLISLDLDSDKYVVISEPELVESGGHDLNWKVQDLEPKIRSFYESLKRSEKLKPPGDINLIINSKFLAEGAEISYREFVVMGIMTEYSKVSEIYRKCELSEPEVTLALVDLRKKGAVRVVR